MQRVDFPSDSLGRRRYPAEFKQSVVEATRANARSIASVARQYGLNANLVHKWCSSSDIQSPAFLPVSVEPEVPTVVPELAGKLGTVNATLTLASGRQLEFKNMNAGALMTLLEVLT